MADDEVCPPWFTRPIQTPHEPQQLLFPDQRTHRIADILVTHHIYLYLTYYNWAFDANGNMILIISYPYGHLFTTVKYGSFDQKRFELDCIEFSKLCLDGFLAEVTDIHIVHLIIQE